MKAQYQTGFELQGKRFSANKSKGKKKTYASKLMKSFCILLIFRKS